MSVVIKQHKENGYYITLSVERNDYIGSYYEVAAHPVIGEHLCGCPTNSIVYHMDERKKALATYRRYIKRYCKNEV